MPFMRDLGLGLELRRKSRTALSIPLGMRETIAAAWSAHVQPSDPDPGHEEGRLEHFVAAGEAARFF